jgi:hypothetical protein
MAGKAKKKGEGDAGPQEREMRIEGRVARILTDEGIVINRGSDHGVREGKRFVVFTELDEVEDPESGDSLGKLELVKARIVASHVQERMAVCTAEPPARPAEAEDPMHHTLSSEMVAVSMLAGRREPGKLPVDRSAATGLPRAGPISVGDRVRSVED